MRMNMSMITTATSSSSSSLSSLFISKLNPTIHKSRNFLLPKPLILHRTFETSRIHSNSSKSPIETNNKPQQPPQHQNSEDSEESVAAAVEEDDSVRSVSSKRSFAVATGELFLGIASRLVNFSKKTEVSTVEELRLPTTENEAVAVEEGERIASVIEDPLEPEVVWEQRVKDVEEEKRRKLVTSPGFSFSAAGLLFPYHLGVAKFLIDNGYIKDAVLWNLKLLI